VLSVVAHVECYRLAESAKRVFSYYGECGTLVVGFWSNDHSNSRRLSEPVVYRCLQGRIEQTTL